MHGANGKNAELREQSFKGVMRFWWRAINGNLSLKELKEKEAEIFGNTSGKSSFRMKIFNKDLDYKVYKLLDYKEEIEQELKKKNLKEQKIKNILKKYEKSKSEGFNPDQTFEIEFKGKNLEKVKNIFILSTVLGGFGQRARRGFGSIKILEIDGKDFQFERLNDDNIIKKVIKQINPEFSFNDENFKSKRKYPYIKNIEIGKEKEYDNYNELLKKIGLATHKYPCFGKASPRYASPIWVSVVKENEKFKPIITSLNGRGCWKNFNDFKGMIL